MDYNQQNALNDTQQNLNQQQQPVVNQPRQQPEYLKKNKKMKRLLGKHGNAIDSFSC